MGKAIGKAEVATGQTADDPTAAETVLLLPDLHALQATALALGAHAHRLHNSGQRIVADFRRHKEALADEARLLEQDRDQQIAAINAAHARRMEHNADMQATVEGMIAYYTGSATEITVQIDAQAVHEPLPFWRRSAP